MVWILDSVERGGYGVLRCGLTHRWMLVGENMVWYRGRVFTASARWDGWLRDVDRLGKRNDVATALA